MLDIFNKQGIESQKNKKYKVWQSGNHAIELINEKFTWTKINYIHQNPVKANLVKNAEDWLYSSATNYFGIENSVLEEVICLSSKLIIV